MFLTPLLLLYLALLFPLIVYSRRPSAPLARVLLLMSILALVAVVLPFLLPAPAAELEEPAMPGRVARPADSAWIVDAFSDFVVSLALSVPFLQVGLLASILALSLELRRRDFETHKSVIKRPMFLIAVLSLILGFLWAVGALVIYELDLADGPEHNFLGPYENVVPTRSR